MKASYLKMPVVAAVSAAVLFFAPSLCAQTLYESPPNDDTMREGVGDYAATDNIEGTVTSIDADGGVITVRPFVATGVGNDQLTIQIMPDAQVYNRAGNTMASSDIQVGDVVTVEYINDPAGLRAVTVNLE